MIYEVFVLGPATIEMSVSLCVLTNFFEFMFGGEILSSSCEGAQTNLLHPYLGTTLRCVDPALPLSVGGVQCSQCCTKSEHKNSRDFDGPQNVQINHMLSVRLIFISRHWVLLFPHSIVECMHARVGIGWGPSATLHLFKNRHMASYVRLQPAKTTEKPVSAPLPGKGETLAFP